MGIRPSAESTIRMTFAAFGITRLLSSKHLSPTRINSCIAPSTVDSPKPLPNRNLKGGWKTMKPNLVPIRSSLCALTALITSALSSAQVSRLIEFDAPGAGTVSVPACAPYCGTTPLANNAEGAVVGFYTDPHVVPHGFLRHRDGAFVSFDAPGAGLGHGKNQGTVSYSINDLGIIAGQFEDSSNVYHGFVRSPDNAFTTFDVSGAGTGANQGTLAFN